jgi:acyl carrier protein
MRVDTRTDAVERVRAIVADVLELDAGEVATDADFYDDLGADSLEKVEIAMRIESEFSVTVAAEDAAAIGTVADAVAMLESKGAL